MDFMKFEEWVRLGTRNQEKSTVDRFLRIATSAWGSTPLDFCFCKQGRHY